jgi:polysaccharide pyruvyl transferase WcaK-like protein
VARTTARGTVRVGLLGEFGIHNYGNEASLAAALAFLRRDPRVAARVVADRTTDVSAEHGVPAVPLHHPRAPRGGVLGLMGKLADAAWAWRTTRRLDALVVPGTGIFEGLAIAPGGIPLTLFWYAVAARVLRRPLLVLSVGVDQAAHPVAARLFRWTLSSARYLSVRDDGSAAGLAALGVRRVPVVVPDLALGTTPGEPVPVPTGPRNAVAVGVIRYQGIGTADGPAEQAAYVARTVRLVERLVADGADVRVVGGALPDEPTVREVVDAAARTCGRAAVVGLHPADLDGVARAFAGCRAVVAVRYHNLVAALRAGLPAVALGYGRKQAWLLEQLGQPGRSYAVDTFDPDVVADQVRDLLARPDAAGDLPARLAVARAALAAQERAVLALLGLGVPPRDRSPAVTRSGEPEAVRA